MTGAASPKVRALLTLIPLGVLIVHAGYYYPFLADDALISLRYAERLIMGQGLTWNDGEFVEGYTNLLWVLATALVGLLGIDLILAARLLGLASALAILLALHHFSVGYRTEAFLLPGLALALIAPTAVWMIGGLETLMLCAFVALAAAGLAHAVERSEPGRLPPGLLLPAGWLSLAVLTRADAPVLVAGFAVGTMLAVRGGFLDRLKAMALVSGIPFATFLAQLGFRLVYYGSLLPNTYYAKFALTDHRFQEGVIYLARFASTVLPFLAVIGFVLLLVLVQRRRGREGTGPGNDDLSRRLALLLPVAAAWTAYVALVGGDIFPAYRQALPILVVLAFAFSAGLGNGGPGKWRSAAVSLTVLGLAGSLALSHRDAENHRAKTERWEWACRDIAEEVALRWGAYAPVVAVTAAGCFPYFSKLQALDMYGLNDPHLTRNRPEDFGYGYMGHELMNPEYVLSRAPEIVVFHIGRNPGIPTAFVRTDFLDRYERVSIEVPGWEGVPGHVWLRNGFP